jgi:hypothetical protein
MSRAYALRTVSQSAPDARRVPSFLAIGNLKDAKNHLMATKIKGSYTPSHG